MKEHNININVLKWHYEDQATFYCFSTFLFFAWHMHFQEQTSNTWLTFVIPTKNLFKIIDSFTFLLFPCVFVFIKTKNHVHPSSFSHSQFHFSVCCCCCLLFFLLSFLFTKNVSSRRFVLRIFHATHTTSILVYNTGLVYIHFYAYT